MARVQVHPVLSQLASPRSYAEQIAALRTVKNETVGHVQRKEKWVELGVLEPIVNLLTVNRPPAKLNGKDTRTNATGLRDLSEGEVARLQALELLAIFASGGSPFIAPLHAAGALPVILSNVSPLDNHPKLVFAALRSLVNLAEAASFALPPSPIHTASLGDTIFAPQHLDSLHEILVAPATTWIAQSQVNTVAKLICQLCRDEDHQNALANCGILDALATKLAGFAVAQGQVVPGAEIIAQNEGLGDWIPEPTPPGIQLSAILEATAAIIADSRLRACMLLYSPSILAVFPYTDFDTSVADVLAAWRALETGGGNTTTPVSVAAMDLLLPAVPSQQSRGSSQPPAYPPLGSSLSRESLATSGRGFSRLGSGLSGWDSSRFEPTSSNGDAETGEPESPLIPWLISLVRSSSGSNDRLMAASVLTSLYKSGFASRDRETAMGLLICPLLVDLLANGELKQEADANSSNVTASGSSIREGVLLVMARLVTDSEILQKAAFDCDAIKQVCVMLKTVYAPGVTEDFRPRSWNPSPSDNSDLETDGRLASCTLGPPGQLEIHTHRAGIREAALKALAALLSFKDDYRKAFVDQDVMVHIVDSLKLTATKPPRSKQQASYPKELASPSIFEDDVTQASHPNAVLIAACHAVRMLSRSVSILRTTLEDAGVAMPVFRLLRHPDIDVQIAATSAICNLVTEVSPMRERFAAAGIMRVLCEHSHSLNASLRLNALWALKHFVHGVGADRKKACLEELEPGWLVRLICDDTEDDALFARTRSEKQAAADDMDEDVDMVQAEEEKSFPSAALHRVDFPRTSHERSRTGRMRVAESKIAAFREAELNPVRKARSDDLAIQEQGLNFIRNIIGPSEASSSEEAVKETTEMIDYLFSQLGQDRLFEILASKLKAKVLHPFSRRYAAGQISRVLYPQAKIIEAVVMILVHMAASDPKHRQLVIAQTELLKALLSHFSSKDKDVRVALCHLLTNLTWRDDPTESQNAAARALELKRLGLLTKLEVLEQEDSELDVRERAKTAIFQISQPYS